MSDLWRTEGQLRYYVIVDGEKFTADGKTYSRSPEEAQERGWAALALNPDADDIHIEHTMVRRMNLGVARAAASLITPGVNPPTGEDPPPDDNPNDLPLIFFDALDNPANSQFFEGFGFTYESGGYIQMAGSSGDINIGSAKLAVGATPTSYLAGVGDTSIKYDDLEYTIDVRVTGGAADEVLKLIRAAGIVRADWLEAFVSHAWEPDPLSLAPVSAIDPNDDTVVGDEYNDTAAWDTLQATTDSGWLGNQAFTDNLVDGEWHTLRVRQKLNTVDQSDGILWASLDGVVQVNLTNVDWRWGWDGDYYWNVIFLEHYVNSGLTGDCNVQLRNLYVRGTGVTSDPTPPEPLAIITQSFLSGYEGTAYNQTVSAANGSAPYTFTIASGSLPSGITLSSAGVLSGTLPTVAEDTDYTFTIQVEDDDEATATRAFMITVFDGEATSDADFELDWGDYASIPAVISAHPSQSEYRTGSNGLVSLNPTTGGGEEFSTELRSILYTPASIDQEYSILIDLGYWADVARPRRLYGHFRMLHTDDWTYDGPLGAGGDPGGKVLFLFDDQLTGAGRYEFYLGLFSDSVAQTNYAGQVGSGGMFNVVVEESTFCDGTYKDFWFHAEMHPTNGIWETNFNGTHNYIGTGVNTDRGPGRYYKFLKIFPNVNTGAENSGMYRAAGKIRLWVNEPPESPF